MHAETSRAARVGGPVIINHAGEDQEPKRSRQIARPRSHEIAKFSSLLAVIVPTYGCGQSKEVQTGHTPHLLYDGPTRERPSNGSALAQLGSVTRNNAAECIRLAEAARTSA